MSINGEECRKPEGGKNDMHHDSCFCEFKKTTKTIIPVANNGDEIKIGYHTNKNLILLGYIKTHV